MSEFLKNRKAEGRKGETKQRSCRFWSFVRTAQHLLIKRRAKNETEAFSLWQRGFGKCLGSSCQLPSSPFRNIFYGLFTRRVHAVTNGFGKHSIWCIRSLKKSIYFFLQGALITKRVRRHAFSGGDIFPCLCAQVSSCAAVSRPCEIYLWGRGRQHFSQRQPQTATVRPGGRAALSTLPHFLHTWLFQVQPDPVSSFLLSFPFPLHPSEAKVGSKSLFLAWAASHSSSRFIWSHAFFFFSSYPLAHSQWSFSSFVCVGILKRGRSRGSWWSLRKIRVRYVFTAQDSNSELGYHPARGSVTYAGTGVGYLLSSAACLSAMCCVLCSRGFLRTWPDGAVFPSASYWWILRWLQVIQHRPHCFEHLPVTGRRAAARCNVRAAPGKAK